MLETIFLILQLFFVVLIFYLTLAFLTGAPFVPTKNTAAQKMIELSHIKKGMTIYDLGSGDGRLLFLSANRGAHSIGFEINPLLVLYTNIRKLFVNNGSLVRCFWKNFWKADLRDADVLFVYLLPWRMNELEKKLISGTKKGTTIVSNSFIFPHWKIVAKDEDHHLYVFRVGE